MSFRSISVLPKCLQGRLALRRAAHHRSFTGCSQCQQSITQTSAAIDYHDEYATDLIETGLEPSFQASKHRKLQLKARSSNEDAQRKPSSLSSSTSRSSNPRKSFKPQPAARIGGALHIPEFLNNVPNIPRTTSQDAKKDNPPSPSTLHARGAQKESAHNHLQSATTKSYLGRYKAWEDLNDQFSEVRRTQPDQMVEIFKTQKEFAKSFIGDISDTEQASTKIRRKWEALSREEQLKFLPSLLVGSLVESASQSLFVLKNIRIYSHTFRIRMNCLRHIGLMYWEELAHSSELRSIYETIIGSLRSPEAWPNDKMPTVLLQNLLFCSTPEQCEKIIKDFQEKFPEAEPSSAIAIIDHYLRMKDPEQAFEYLKRLPGNYLRQHDIIITALRDRLLKLDVVATSETGTNFKYLPQLLALGMPPDEGLHNTVIESAIANGLPDVAWDLYQYLQSSRFQSNARSHLVLLRDAFRRGDLSRVDTLMTAIHNREDLISDQYLMAYSMNIIRNISSYEKTLKTREAHAHITALYDRAYDRGPLVRLGVVQPLAMEVSLPAPSSTLLAFTLWTYILIQHRATDVLRLWEWIKYLIANKDTAVVEAAKHDIIYNGLMLFHSRQPYNLGRALEVMQFMLSSKLCTPTSRSWSILLCSFLKHGQQDQAAKVLALMQSHGYTVQHITERYSSYLPIGSNLESIAKSINQSLNEKDMPEGMEELLQASQSLQGEANINRTDVRSKSTEA